VKRFKKMLAKAKDAGEKSMLAKKIIGLKKLKAETYIKDAAAKQKYMQRLAEEGAEIKSWISDEKKGGSKVAKGRKKKGGKKKTAKKKATKKAASRKKKSTRGRKKGRSKAQKAALRKMQAAAKKARKAKKGGRRKSRKGKRKYPKMVSHKHAKSTRHIRKGSTAKVSARKKKGSYRISTYFGKGKKRVRMTGRLRASKSGLKGSFKINPFRRNPLKNIAAQTKKYMGLDAAELTSLALGGALVPIANGLVSKYVPKAASMVSQYVGPQAAGSVIPILLGVAANALAEHGVKSGAGHEYLKKAGEGLAAAGIIGLTMSLAQQYVNPMIGLSGMGIMPSMNGVNYTPMRGVNYTPMRGVNYTPSMRGMGIVPSLAGADFGAADYGGGGGSREAVTQSSDFGAWQSQDSESDVENSYSSSMN
jgi:adenylate kinase/ribonuclease R